MSDPVPPATGRLRTVLRTGPFTYAVQSDIPRVSDAMRDLYASSVPDPVPPFADFHLALAVGRSLRAPWRREATLCVDGQTVFDPFPVAMAFPYLEWGMNQCIARTAHQYLMMHAAVVGRGGGAAIITGPTGSGKSTLCAALAAAGWRLFSDELALVATTTGQLSPLGRPISLKNESIELMQRLAPGWRFGPLCEGGRKGRIRHMAPPVSAVPSVATEALPAWFVFVRYAAGSVCECKPLEKGPCMMRAIEQCFNYAKLGRTGFRALAEVVARCVCVELTYSDTRDAVAAMDALASSGGGGAAS